MEYSDRFPSKQMFSAFKEQSQNSVTQCDHMTQRSHQETAREAVPGVSWARIQNRNDRCLYYVVMTSREFS